ncbi:unnamed protein product, partial [Iphiclides podalirius]
MSGTGGVQLIEGIRGFYDFDTCPRKKALVSKGSNSVGRCCARAAADVRSICPPHAHSDIGHLSRAHVCSNLSLAQLMAGRIGPALSKNARANLENPAEVARCCARAALPPAMSMHPLGTRFGACPLHDTARHEEARQTDDTFICR